MMYLNKYAYDIFLVILVDFTFKNSQSLYANYTTLVILSILFINSLNWIDFFTQLFSFCFRTKKNFHTNLSLVVLYCSFFIGNHTMTDLLKLSVHRTKSTPIVEVHVDDVYFDSKSIDVKFVTSIEMSTLL